MKEQIICESVSEPVSQPNGLRQCNFFALAGSAAAATLFSGRGIIAGHGCQLKPSRCSTVSWKANRNTLPGNCFVRQSKV